MEKGRLQKIVSALEAKKARLPCSRCGHRAFEVVAETHMSIQANPAILNVGGPSLRSVLVACANCGHVWAHALGPLGLTPEVR